MNTVSVLLTEEESKRLLLMQKYFILIGLLEKIGDTRSGYIQIHFDALGRIVGMDKHEHLKV